MPKSPGLVRRARAGVLDGPSGAPLGFLLILKPCTKILRRHAWQLGASLGVAALLAGAVIPAAAADPIADQQAQARSLAAQIDSLGKREAALSEQYDKAQLEAQAAGVQVAQAAQ